jgi:hypothetical protein
MPAMQQSAVVQPSETAGERRESAGGCLLVVQRSERGHPVGLADHQPAKLDNRLLQHRNQIVARQGGQIRFQVGGLCQCGDPLEERRDGALQCVVHDRQQQFLLVAEVLVDRLLGHCGVRGDLVHARALVAVAQEQRPARRQDGLPLTRRAAQHFGHSASSIVLDSLVPKVVQYWTV